MQTPPIDERQHQHGVLRTTLEKKIDASSMVATDGDRIGFEKVGSHAGAIADIVADVVGDDGRVARIIFGNAGFDLTHEIGTDVGALGEDAAAETREDRDQRGAEGQRDQRFEDRPRIFDPQARAQEEVVESHAEEAETDDQHAGDGARFE